MSKKEKLINLIAEVETQKERYPNNWGKVSYLAAALDIITQDTNSFRGDAEEIITICCPEYWEGKNEKAEIIDDYLKERE